ncbi:JM119 [macacine gammaherpesvirus 11]|uniref:Ribonucleoside-diphosphate reductase large subunit n=2 Tax=macacine gammaherpesvirus 11 TaxID=2560570 RepID=G9JMC7_9GAMA|nr:JM119 [Macaca fuscata rhadinovirus]AAT00096.1 JM119 [Macaca fuscata rhadinovirus]AEW87644.1 JM119 [Macaca fuscata rhadinovirus]AEW87814.1 JM119 [Macaca fuscata rhadinovirus]
MNTETSFSAAKSAKPLTLVTNAETGGCSSSLDPERCAESLVNSLKATLGWDVEANSLTGLLWHRIMEDRCLVTVKDYLTVFGEKLSDEVREFMLKHEAALDGLLQDFKQSKAYANLVNCGYLSAVRFYDTYVLRTHGSSPIFESVAQMFMRVAVFVACQCIKFPCLRKTLRHLVQSETELDEMYLVGYAFHYISSQIVCCATPVLRSAGLRGGQLSSCFILKPSMATENKTLKALHEEMSPLLASKSGVGIDVSSFAEHKNITSCLKLINAHVGYFNDNNIRPVGASAYMELWHHQICDFLNAKMPENQERCHNLFQGVCVPELFFRLYETNPDGQWHLFAPEVAPNLLKLYGAEFEIEYNRLVAAGKHSSSLPLKSMMYALINTVIKTGSPYVLLKEALNKHHWCETQGSAINCSNLCAEIVQQPEGQASVCNLANISLPKCLRPPRGKSGVEPGKGDVTFGFELLDDAVEAAVIIVNACILGGTAPTESVRRGQKERSMGIGVQGLADVFAELGFGYLDAESAKLDVEIFQAMYFAAVHTSHEIVLLGEGTPFHGWERSRLAQGVFHWQTWDGVKPSHPPLERWEQLGRSIAQHGIFNSQFLALMPTAGTSQLTGYTEAFYPFFANIASKVTSKEEILKPNVTFFKRVKPGDLRTVRRYGGDVASFPEPLKDRYKIFLTAFDYCPIKQLERAGARAPFVDQSQSLNFFLKEEQATRASYIRDLLLTGYRLGLKTMLYYCRIQKQTKLNALQCLDQVVGDNTSSEGAESNRVQKADGEQAEVCLACQ